MDLLRLPFHPKQKIPYNECSFKEYVSLLIGLYKYNGSVSHVGISNNIHHRTNTYHVLTQIELNGIYPWAIMNR